MKKLVLDHPETEIINYKNARPALYYGVLNQNNDKAFISFNQINNVHQVLAAKSINFRDNWGVESSILIDLIHYLLKVGYEVFEFENHKQLFAWLAK